MTNRDDLERQRAEIIEGTKEIVAQLRKHQEEYSSLDMTQLEKDGVINKKGAWYLVLDMSKAPESFKSLISEAKENPKGKGILVKLSKRKDPFSKTIKQFEKLGF